MTRRCYIAAPWWHPSFEIRVWNTRRAELLAALARADGFEPVYVHRDLLNAGVDDDADPAGREAGLAATCELIREIAREKTGTMWGLCLDSLRLSDGCLVERGAWLAERPTECGEQWSTSWNGWRLRMDAAGLGVLWAALVGVPTTACPQCGAPVVLDKQDAMMVNGQPYTERIEACDSACGWYGRTRLFPGGSPDLRGLSFEDLHAEAAAAAAARRRKRAVPPC